MLFSDHKELNGMNKQTRNGRGGKEKTSEAHVTYKSVSDGLVW